MCDCHVCVNLCVICVGAHVCMCVDTSSRKVSSTLVLEQGLSPGLELANSPRLVGHQASKICLSLEGLTDLLQLSVPPSVRSIVKPFHPGLPVLLWVLELNSDSHAYAASTLLYTLSCLWQTLSLSPFLSFPLSLPFSLSF